MNDSLNNRTGNILGYNIIQWNDSLNNIMFYYSTEDSLYIIIAMIIYLLYFI